jgi:hypothetical protein
MKHSFMTALAATVFTLGLALAQPVQARGDIISDEEAGMVCDESTMGYSFDNGVRIYQCNGRNWVDIGGL